MVKVVKSSVARAGRGVAACATIALAVSCGDAAKPAAIDSSKLRAIPATDGVVVTDSVTRSLALASGAAAYREDESPAAPGDVSGVVQLTGTLPNDTTVTPDRDSTGCRPFEDVTLPRERGRRTNADSTQHEIGNAIVWLVGVTHGPRMTLPRRVSMVLDNCHFEPRVLVAPVGATIMASNRDDIIAKLKFVDHGITAAPREEIGFTDPGSLVPSSKALAEPGLVEVRDDKHPWIRGYIAVAPHPFVTVTGTDGKFLFEGVPAGTYQLVAWHERLGSVVLPVRVQQGVATVIAATFKR